MAYQLTQNITQLYVFTLTGPMPSMCWESSFSYAQPMVYDFLVDSSAQGYVN